MHAVMQPFSFLFFCGGLRLWFWVCCCAGGALIPQGFLPWNLGHFLLVQKVTKDTLKRRGIAIYLRAKSLASLGCAPKRACGRSPLSLKNLISLNRQRRGLRAPPLIFPRDITGKIFHRKQSKKSTHAPIEYGQRPQSTAPNTKKQSAQNDTLYRPLSVSGARGERHAKDAPIFDTICDEIRLY